jgi:hypothetical protein
VADLIILTGDELDELEARYSWVEPPPCRCCLQPLEQANSGGSSPATYACSSQEARLIGKTGIAFEVAKEHYVASKWQQPWKDDLRVVAVIQELRDLRRRLAETATPE